MPEDIERDITYVVEHDEVVHRRCEGCGSTLGGSRHRLALHDKEGN